MYHIPMRNCETGFTGSIKSVYLCDRLLWSFGDWRHVEFGYPCRWVTRRLGTRIIYCQPILSQVLWDLPSLLKVPSTSNGKSVSGAKSLKYKQFVDVSFSQDGLLCVHCWRGKIVQQFESTASEEVHIKIQPKYQTQESVISQMWKRACWYFWKLMTMQWCPPRGWEHNHNVTICAYSGRFTPRQLINTNDHDDGGMNRSSMRASMVSPSLSAALLSSMLYQSVKISEATVKDYSMNVPAWVKLN